MSGIKVQNLAKHWGSFRAVDDLSFETQQAEFIALLGPSGCGKSTTLRLIAGLDDVTSGQIFINGRDITALAPARRNISMVFQSYALFPHLTVAENIEFGLSVRKVAKSERAQRLQRVVKLLGLEQLLDRRPSQLSGGQQQRVALGRALVSETPVCLLDEPMSNLDAKLRAGMRGEIRSLQKRLGITMVYVTHDQTEAMSMADRVILLNRGRIEQNGTPAELYERPASVFVAQFIGSPPMNILDFSRSTLDPNRAVGACVLPSIADSGLLLGIRPEHIAIADEGESAVVGTSEYFGADTVVSCRIGEQWLQVRAPGRPDLAPGSVVRLTWPAQAMHFFYKSTGLRRDGLQSTQ